MKVEQKSLKQVFEESCGSDYCVKILVKAIADHSLDSELIKLLPKEFYEKQGYVRSGICWFCKNECKKIGMETCTEKINIEEK